MPFNRTRYEDFALVLAFCNVFSSVSFTRTVNKGDSVFFSVNFSQVLLQCSNAFFIFIQAFPESPLAVFGKGSP